MNQPEIMKTDLLLEQAESSLVYKAMQLHSVAFRIKRLASRSTLRLQNKALYARPTAKLEEETEGKIGSRKEVGNFCLLGCASIFYLEDNGIKCL
jgi:hypothetical protein